MTLKMLPHHKQLDTKCKFCSHSSKVDLPPIQDQSENILKIRLDMYWKESISKINSTIPIVLVMPIILRRFAASDSV